MTDMTFDQRFQNTFQKAFDDGLADIKFFVKRDSVVTLDGLRADALAFQEAINSKNITEVESVD